jgi:hypothetical protein
MVLRRVVLLVLGVLTIHALPSLSAAQSGVDCRISVAPPPLPVYDQPPIPAHGYIWTPGYWAWGEEGYYWTPGTWVEPPSVGMLWTPGYWGWSDRAYIWHAGYWGPHVGFYGGINYGFGYVGVGFEGGRWENGSFAYNTAVTNIGSVHITNVYSATVVNNTTITNVSFNGGNGGTITQPTPQERAAEHEQHVPATAAQTQHERTASTNRALLASVNSGKPAVAATAKPGELSGHGVIAARSAGSVEGPQQHLPAAQRPASSERPATALTPPHSSGTPEHSNTPEHPNQKHEEAKPVEAPPAARAAAKTSAGSERAKETFVPPKPATAAPKPRSQEPKRVAMRPETSPQTNPAVASRPGAPHQAAPHLPQAPKPTANKPKPQAAHQAQKKPDHR